MKILKKLLKARVIVWLATTIVLIVVMIVGNSITNQYSLILDNVLGGKRPIVSDEESGIPFEQQKKFVKKAWFFLKMKVTPFH